MNPDWESAVNSRRSIRNFEMSDVEDPKMNLFQSFTDQIKTPFEHNVKIRWFKANPDKKLYFSFDSPPDNIAFVTNTDCRSVSAAGFVGEITILYATSLGLATCWYGHYNLAELERLMPHLGESSEGQNPKWGYGKGETVDERAICISPLGYWKKEGIRLLDRMQESLLSYKRKPIEDLLEEGLTKENLPPEILYALDLARKAPSAANSQHWRINVSNDMKTISLAMPVGYKHIKWEHPDVDIGICASHFWLGLGLKNINCMVQLDDEQGRVVWRFIL